MLLVRNILTLYRRMQYFVCGRKEYGSISNYTRCTIIGDIEDYKKDCVHPCVRYSEKPFLRYHWWMVYTPYYNANAMQENPILCYGEGNGEPPTEWYVYKEIVSQPATGYNSDPNLLFHNDKLYLFWRENETPRLKSRGLTRGTFSICVTEKGMSEIDIPLLLEVLPFEDHEVSPVFLSYRNNVLAMANHLLFKNPRLQTINYKLKAIYDKLFLVTDLLGIYAQQKSYGIAIWKGQDFDSGFSYDRTIYPKNCNHLYRPWHSDAFEYNGSLYMIMQSNQCNADICIAKWNEDLTELKMSKQPLITNYSIKKVGIYKPTAVMYQDFLYIYVSAQEESNRASNLLFRSHIAFNELKALFS